MDGSIHYGYNAKTGEYDIPLEEEDTVKEVTVFPGDTLKGMRHGENDPVNHPSHYTSGKIEVIDFLEDQNLPFHLANALKYICRAGKKNPEKTAEDLEKAVWYLNRYISHVLKAPEDAS